MIKCSKKQAKLHYVGQVSFCKTYQTEEDCYKVILHLNFYVVTNGKQYSIHCTINYSLNRYEIKKGSHLAGKNYRRILEN